MSQENKSLWISAHLCTQSCHECNPECGPSISQSRISRYSGLRSITVVQNHCRSFGNLAHWATLIYQANDHVPYPGIFYGIGKLKNFYVTLHTDKSVTPVVRKHSHIPFHLRKKPAKTSIKNDATKQVSRFKRWFCERCFTGSNAWVLILFSMGHQRKHGKSGPLHN